MCSQMRSRGNRHYTRKHLGCSLSSYAMLCACLPQCCMSYCVRALERVARVTSFLLACHNMTLQCRQGQPADSAGHGILKCKNAGSVHETRVKQEFKPSGTQIHCRNIWPSRNHLNKKEPPSTYIVGSKTYTA